MKAQEAGAAQRDAAMNQIGGLELQAGEADIGRQFAVQQGDKDMAFKRSLFDLEQGNKVKELNLAERQFALDADTTGFNRRMAELEANRETPGLLGGGGFMGTGIDMKNPVGSISKDPVGALTRTNMVTAPFAAMGGGGK